jgi:cytochrome c oxidase assembly factor CtaG
MRDECSLTLLEMKLRGIENCNESFFWNVVSPIYKPRTSDTGKQLLWLASVVLWLITLSKVLKNPHMVVDVFRAAMLPFKKSDGPLDGQLVQVASGKP